MKFRTELQLPKSEINIKYTESTILLGSCFAENIGNKLLQLKYDTTVNPMGVVYHPFPLHTSIVNALDSNKIELKDLIKNREGLYTSWNFHSKLSRQNATETLELMNIAIDQLYIALKSSNYLILTYGTAYHYNHNDYGPVANCHKFPPNDFTKKLSSSVQIINSFQEMYSKLLKVNPNIKILISLSPVRHIKDGMVENNRSKAHLLTAIHEICDLYSDCHYIPSYELLMDDLRDYRYYKNDLVHPSNMAVDYIWSKISSHLLDPKESRLRKDINKIINAAAHRPFNSLSDAHQLFKEAQISSITEILKNYPDIDFEPELRVFNSETK